MARLSMHSTVRGGRVADPLFDGLYLSRREVKYAKTAGAQQLDIMRLRKYKVSNSNAFSVRYRSAADKAYNN